MNIYDNICGTFQIRNYLLKSEELGMGLLCSQWRDLVGACTWSASDSCCMLLPFDKYYHLGIIKDA